VFQVSADRAGVVEATLRWTKEQNDLRLEVWDGNDGDGMCCRSGERVSVLVARGDQVEIYVILAIPRGKSTHQPFDLSTSFQRQSG
jgi:hypothetical protein